MRCIYMLPSLPEETAYNLPTCNDSDMLVEHATSTDVF